MQITQYSYRFASEVLDSPGFLPLKTDILEILASVQDIPGPQKAKTRARGKQTWNFTTDQKALNKVLDAKFLEREWACQPPVTADKVTAIKADYKKGRVPQKYPGKKYFKGPKAGQYSCNPLGKNPGDVWVIPNVKNNHVEKTVHPCQFPNESNKRSKKLLRCVRVVKRFMCQARTIQSQSAPISSDQRTANTSA